MVPKMALALKFSSGMDDSVISSGGRQLLEIFLVWVFPPLHC